MTRAIAGAVVLAAAVAACFSTPTRPGTGDSGVNGDGKLTDSLNVDAMINIDGNPNNCTTDSFVGSGSGTCGNSGWAFLTTTNGMATLSNTASGELKVTIFGGTGSLASCTGSQSPWNRFTVDVQEVAASGTTNRTFVGIQSADGQARWGLDFADLAGSPGFTARCDGAGTTSAATTWNSLTHRYVKIELERALPPKVTVSTSQDNIGFNEITHCTPTAELATTQAQLRVYEQPAGSGSSMTSTSDIATFGFVELCHD